MVASTLSLVLVWSTVIWLYVFAVPFMVVCTLQFYVNRNHTFVRRRYPKVTVLSCIISIAYILLDGSVRYLPVLTHGDYIANLEKQNIYYSNLSALITIRCFTAPPFFICLLSVYALRIWLVTTYLSSFSSFSSVFFVFARFFLCVCFVFYRKNRNKKKNKQCKIQIFQGLL